MRLTSLYHLAMRHGISSFNKKVHFRSPLLVLSVLLAGCPSGEKPEAPKAPVSAAPPAPEKTASPSGVPTPTSSPQIPAVQPTAPGTGVPANQPAGTSNSKSDGGAVQVVQVPVFGNGIRPPSLCEVEFKGKVVYKGKLPEGQRWFFAVAQGGDCLSKDAHIIGNFWAEADGSFFGEVFAKWASDLTLCVAAVSTPNGPSTLYAKAKGPFHAEKIGEVEFFGLELTPTTGRQIQFATGRAPM